MVKTRIKFRLPAHEWDIMDTMDETLMSVDEKLWGLDILEKPVPHTGDLCLVWDTNKGKMYKSIISHVNAEARTFHADYLDIPIRNENVSFIRFRPISE